MSNHFLSINRGKLPNIGSTTLSHTGTSSTAGDDVEVRIADVDGNGHALTKKDVEFALEAILRYIRHNKSTFPPI